MAVVHEKSKTNDDIIPFGKRKKRMSLCGHWVYTENVTYSEKDIVTCIKCKNIINDDWPKYEGGYNAK